MENKTAIFEPLLERAEEYGKTSFELIKLKTVDKTTGVLSTMLSQGIMILMLFTFAITLNAGLALWLGGLLGKIYYGFFCVAAIDGIISIVLYIFFYDKIKRYFGNMIVTKFLN